jgi:hypothetical protein
MAIEVIDNFVVNVEKPIDNRFVVGPQSFYTDKDSIPYKYEGLRIWDLNDSQPYVWTGSAWSSESGVGNLSGLGTGGYFSKYVGGADSSQLTNSVVFELSSNVIIGGTTNPDSDKLRVVGSIRATGNIIGNGSQITSINASNISTGTLSINRLQNGTTSQLLVAGASSPTWINPSSVTVGNATNATNATTATNANNINIISNSINSNNQYIPFVTSTGIQEVKINTTNSIRVNPSNGNIQISGNILQLGSSDGNSQFSYEKSVYLQVTTGTAQTIYTIPAIIGEFSRYEFTLIGYAENDNYYTARRSVIVTPNGGFGAATNVEQISTGFVWTFSSTT